MEAVLRAAIVYVFLWLVLRGIAKRDLSELTAFQLVIVVAMGDLVQQGVTQEDMSLTGAMIAVGTMVLLMTATSALSYRSKRLRPLLESKPVLLISDGHVQDEILQLERIPVDDLLEAAREAGVDDLQSVRWCVLEVDGRMSFVTAGDGGGSN